MASKHEIDEFLAQKTLAIAGVSRSGKKFGNTILRDLTKLGYRLLPVHPEAAVVDAPQTPAAGPVNSTTEHDSRVRCSRVLGSPSPRL